MLSKTNWTRIIVVASALALCWAAAYLIEDAGKHPYRAYQMTSTKQWPQPAQVDPLDGLIPFMR